MIEFYSLIPELVDTMPIIPSKEYRYNWYDLAIKDLRNKSQGTPIQQYILIKDDDVQHNVRAHNTMDQG